MSMFFLKIFEKLHICPKSLLTSLHLCPRQLLPGGIYPFRFHCAFTGRIYTYWGGPPPPTMNHIIVDSLACNLLFFFQQCWTFSPFQCVGILLNLDCLSHLSPSFPPALFQGPKQQSSALWLLSGFGHGSTVQDVRVRGRKMKLEGHVSPSP